MNVNYRFTSPRARPSLETNTNSVRFRFIPIHGEVPRRRRQHHLAPIQRPLFTRHLTPQPARRRQPVRQIQHVVLVVARLIQRIENLFIFKNHVTRRTRERTLARALQLDIVPVRRLQQVFPDEPADDVRLPVAVDEPDLYAVRVVRDAFLRRRVCVVVSLRND